jgi:uncharacterized protein
MSKKKKKNIPKTGLKPWQKIASAVIIVAFTAFIVLTFLPEDQTSGRKHEFMKEGELTFLDSAGSRIKTIDIEIADNEYERQMGLMFRDKMEENQGMLFIFPYQSMQSFWMRNTKLSLDILFVNNQKKIVTIHKGTDILSDKSYPSTEPAQYVVEVIAGFTERYNITEGGSIDWQTNRLIIK